MCGSVVCWHGNHIHLQYVPNCEQLYMVVIVTVIIGCHGYIRDWLS